MKILLINHYAGAPTLGMEYRHFYFAREWQKHGHKVLIVTASFTHLRSKQFNSRRKVENHIIDGVSYLVLKTPEYTTNNHKRVLNILTFLWRLYLARKKISADHNPDIVISSSTFVFDIYSAKKIADLSGAKLVFEVKDLWPLSPMELGGYFKWHPFIFLMQQAENFAYTHSIKVISLLPKSFDYMVKHGLQSEKFVYVPNGICIEEWNTDLEVQSEIQELILKLKANNKILLGYSGNHGIANSLDVLVDAMKLLENDNVELFLIGQGQEKENLINRSKQLQLNNIHFIAAVPKSKIPSLLNKFDILYIGLQNQPVFKYGISPNKLIDYMMAGKPIIQAISAGNDIVTEAECGISIEPGNSEAIVQAVRRLISLPEKSIKTFGANGKQYCLNNHDYKILAKKFMDELN